MPTLDLPLADGAMAPYTVQDPRPLPRAERARFTRVALAAVHVVADPFADIDPWLTPAIDFEATMAFRRHIWSLGLGVAEAMDTAQRGMGLDWPMARELIRHSVAEARNHDGAILFSGAGTDHLAPKPGVTVDDVIRAYEEQCEAVEAMGGRLVIMASRALAACAASPADYEAVYDRILGQVAEPVIIHWLGEMFDPALGGYWGHADHGRAMDVVAGVVAANAASVDGIKISLLDKDREIALRRRLPGGVRMYSGDDFNYPELIAGDEQGHSDALLGIFDPIAPAASAALDALARGNRARFDDILAPTVPLSRHIFRTPTRFYKTGVVFLAWLNGLQDHFVMVGGQQSARSLIHLAEVFRLADGAGLLRDPEMAAARMRRLLALHGVGARSAARTVSTG